MGKGLTVAGFVCSLLGLVLSFFGGWLSIIALPVAITGLVLAVVGGKKLKENHQSTGLATAGMVIGIIATIFSAIMFFTCGICVICTAAALS